MSNRLLVGTKKGLFALRQARGRWTIDGTSFLGDPISMLLADPRDGALYAAQALGHFGVKLQRSRDDGQSWQEIPAPAFPKSEGDGASLSYVFCLETGSAEQPGWLWCGTIPGALFLSKDHGDSWTLNDPLWNLPERKEWMGGVDLRRSAQRRSCHGRGIHRRCLGEQGLRPELGCSVRGHVCGILSAAEAYRTPGAGCAPAGAMPGGAGHDVGAAP